MQNRYVGDVGDFIKIALLKSLSPGYSLGVVWYLVDDEWHNADGRHVSYLNHPDWQKLDPHLFAELRRIVQLGKRNIVELERLACFTGCKFISEPLPLPLEYRLRAQKRSNWVSRASDKISGCNLVFLDPDNGLEPLGFSPARKKSIKSVSFNDLRTLREDGRTLVVYHHHTRRAGGHVTEIAYNADRLRNEGFELVDALRAGAFSPRVFFLLNATEEIRVRAAKFAARWRPVGVTWHESPTENPRGGIVEAGLGQGLD